MSQACSGACGETCSYVSSGYSSGSGRSSNSSQNGDSIDHDPDKPACPVRNGPKVIAKCVDSSHEPNTIGADDDERSIELDDSDSDSDLDDDDDDGQSSSSNELDSSNWTISSMLELPVWKHSLAPLRFDTNEQFDVFCKELQDILRQQMSRYTYNTFGSFVYFCRQFTAARAQQPDLALDHFFASFRARLLPNALSCVGLSMILLEQLRQRLADKYVGLAAALGPVSCEEFVKDVGSYTLHSANALKEHVLLAICIQFQGRSGYILLDPGYHVAQPVVVMQDNQYPHSGWFVHSQQGAGQKSFCYQLVANQLVTWTVRESVTTFLADQPLQQKPKREYCNLIHVKQLFANSVAICEKRSYLYSFKSYVIRNHSGSIAGFYCYLRTGLITFFYPDEKSGERVQRKYTVDQLLNDDMIADVHRVAKHMLQQPNVANHLLRILRDFEQVLADKALINQMMAIDRWIEEEL